MRKMLAGLFWRALNPIHLLKAARLHCNRKANRHAFVDAQLALVTKILPSDFLHYGYFDDPDLIPEEMKLADICAPSSATPNSSSTR